MWEPASNSRALRNQPLTKSGNSPTLCLGEATLVPMCVSDIIMTGHSSGHKEQTQKEEQAKMKQLEW